MTYLRTSKSNPLRIDELAVPGTDGLLGLTICPGKQGDSVFGGAWARDLNADLTTIRDWGAKAVVTLMEPHELDMLGVTGLGQRVNSLGLEWLHLPIPDMDAPGADFEQGYADGGARLCTLLSLGERVLLHCRGGLGRTGTVAARMLIEFGLPPAQALDAVRAARSGTVETHVQETYVLNLKPRPWRRTPERYAACLLGGALGDALGWPVEFDSMDTIRAEFGPEGIVRPVANHKGVYEITDDTQMTLFTVEGLLRGHAGYREGGEKREVLVDETLKAYWRWLLTQDEPLARGVAEQVGKGGLMAVAELHAQRAPGSTCLAALRSGKRGSLAEPLNDSKGSGAVMRAAPVGLFMQSPEFLSYVSEDEVDELTFEIGCAIGALTHGHPSGNLPAGFLALLIGRLVDGDTLPQAIATARSALLKRAGHYETLAAIDRAVTLAAKIDVVPGPAAVARLGEGWTGEEALAIGLYCALVANGDFIRGVRLAVNHGGDSDSTGAIAGNILGLLCGVGGVPAEWIGELELGWLIRRCGIDLYAGKVIG